jgi:type IV fimbrial biogenesis protein FimT
MSTVPKPSAARRFEGGFTMIELAVVLTITAVLVTLAAPSFKRAYQSAAISSAVNSFMADMRFARSEAIRRGGNVVVCRTNNPDAANPSCGTGSGPDGNGWVSGWIVFHDLNADTNRNGTDTVLRVHPPVRNVDSIQVVGNVKFNFFANGRINHNMTMVSFGSIEAFDEDLRRVLCVSKGGRVRVAGDGWAECASS